MSGVLRRLVIRERRERLAQLRYRPMEFFAPRDLESQTSLKERLAAAHERVQQSLRPDSEHPSPPEAT